MISLNPFKDYYLAAIACKTDDPCDALKENFYNPTFLGRMRNSNTSFQGTIETANFPGPIQTDITPIPISGEKPLNAKAYLTTVPTLTADKNATKEVDELNKKVSDLEKKLEESKQKQSFLEQRLNDILTLLKRLIPFIK